MKNPILLPLIFWLLSAVGVHAQDTLVFENKHTYLVEILEESETKVTYRKYNELDSLIHTLPKRFITNIGYFDPTERAAKFKPDTIESKIELDLWVTKTGGGGIVKGVLDQVNDTMLILKKQTSLFRGSRKGLPEMVHILPYHQIDVISARRQNRVVQQAFIGAVVGFAAGTLTGMLVFKDTESCDPILDAGCDASLHPPFTVNEKALALGFGSAGVGALAGGIYGGVKVKIPIRGQRYLFNSAVPLLHRMKRAMRK